MGRSHYEMDKSLFNIDMRELYVETKPFSKGAYSKVYRALYKDQKVCVKMISKDLEPDDPNFFEYVEREIRILKSLQHPNIIEFIGAGEDEEDFYIVTEYIPGGNIRQYLQDEQVLTWDLKIHIAIGVAQGLEHLHRKCILHRDIKSENFLVGDRWQIKVCDFGFARQVESLGRKRSMSICGTEEYMSPELLVGLDYNEKVDVFSYGIFLAELITRCYLPTDLKRTAATQFGVDLMRLKDIVPDGCPSQIFDLIIDCCNFSTSSRPSFDRIVQRLVDIKALFPRFVLKEEIGTFDYFEEVLTPYNESSKYIRKSKPVVEEEITYKEYFVDEAEQAHDLDTLELQFEEICLKEINIEELSEVHIDSDGEESVLADSTETSAIKPMFDSFCVQGTRTYATTATPLYLRTDEEEEEKETVITKLKEEELSHETEDSQEEQSEDDFLEMEEVSVSVVQVPEEEPEEHMDFKLDLVLRNEKYSYYYG